MSNLPLKMIREFSSEALVLKVGDFGENHCWVRFVTPKSGLMMAYAFGGKKSKKRFCGCLDALSFVRFRVCSDKYHRYFTLQEGELLNSFSFLKHNSTRLGLAVNCVLFFSALLEESQGGDGSYELLVRVFQILNDAELVGDFFPLLFRARLMHEQGFFPKIHSCTRCGADLAQEERVFFQPQDGRLFCPHCSGRQGHSFSSFVLPFLQGLFLQDPVYWARVRLDRKMRQECVRLVDGFVEGQLGLIWEGGRFVRR